MITQKTVPVSIQSTTAKWEDLSLLALKHLVEEYNNGYANTKHTMPFPKDQFKVTEDFQTGDVFQRALIADTFLDFESSVSGLKEIIRAEADYLLSTRRTNGIGGWAYFPGLPELAPDADDLAQVMQVMLRAGYREKASPLFEMPLATLLEQQANDTAWETWILPNHDKTEEQELQTEWINTAWGTGSDIEVVANLIYALTLYDTLRFEAAISRGINFLLNSHENNHYWKSTWYYGNYYGTYVSLRALCAANAPIGTIANAIEFLETSRLPDGGWEIEGHGSSPLQTALALLSLSIAKQHLGQQPDRQWLAKSLGYLNATYNTNEGWRSSPFIQMPMGRPYGFIHTTLTYESTSITNNYVAKACNHLSQNHIH